jgi:5-oxoprolinase (ATP-hydrolysing) subunit A
LQQVLRMVKEGKVTSQQGTEVSMQADTVCIHGDGPHALEFAKYINQSLTQAGIRLKAI